MSLKIFHYWYDLNLHRNFVLCSFINVDVFRIGGEIILCLICTRPKFQQTQSNYFPTNVQYFIISPRRKNQHREIFSLRTIRYTDELNKLFFFCYRKLKKVSMSFSGRIKNNLEWKWPLEIICSNVPLKARVTSELFRDVFKWI